MTSFTGRVLKRLDSIWRFVGGVQGLSDMNLEGSVQPVTDFSRLAELGSGLGASDGYFMKTMVFGFAGVGTTTRNTTDPWDFVDTFEPQRERASVWVMGCWASLTNSNVEEVGISVTFPQIGDGSVDERELLLAYFNGPVTIPVTLGTTGSAMWMRTDTAGQMPGGLSARMPLWLPDGAILNFMAKATGAGTVYITVLLWAGASGARAPGVA